MNEIWPLHQCVTPDPTRLDLILFVQTHNNTSITCFTCSGQQSVSKTNFTITFYSHAGAIAQKCYASMRTLARLIRTEV